MKRKYESVSTPKATPKAEDLVAEAVQKFKKRITSSFPPLRLREFYNEDKIREVAQVERKKVFDEYNPLIMTFRGKDMGEMVTQLDTGIERVTEELLNANRHNNEEIFLLIGKMMDFLCEEYKLFMEAQLSLNPDMGSRQRKKLLQDEKTRIIKFFSDHCNQWNAEVVQEQLSKLEEEVNRVQRVVGENHLGRAASSAPASAGSASVPVAEKERFVQMEGMILKTCEELKDSWNADFKRLGKVVDDYGRRIHWEKEGYHIDGYIEQVEMALVNGPCKSSRFTNPEYQEPHDKLKQVLALATKTLSLTVYPIRQTARKSIGFVTRKPRKQVADTYVDGNDALMWQRAFELDMRNCLPTQRVSSEFKSDCHGFELCLSKLIVKKSCEEVISKSSKWTLEGFSSRRKLQEVVKAQESSFGVDFESSRRPPKMFTERLYGAWKSRKPEVESDADEDTGSSSDQGSEDEDASASEASDEKNASGAEQNNSKNFS